MSDSTVIATSLANSVGDNKMIEFVERNENRAITQNGQATKIKQSKSDSGNAAKPSGDKSLRKDYRYNMKTIYEKKNMGYKILKRAFDIVSSGLALIVLSPVFLCTAIAIKLEDGGPVFFHADRFGKGMSHFRMHKFRSMVVDPDGSKLKELMKNNEMDGHTFKIKDDPRITKVGKFIRRTSIDELPQLWNIFVGEMSVVGPRPIITFDMSEWDEYDMQRWIVQPGLTCIWQISGRADISWEQWVEMDFDYIEKMSMIEDLKLIFGTIPAVLKGEGAY